MKTASTGGPTPLPEDTQPSEAADDTATDLGSHRRAVARSVAPATLAVGTVIDRYTVLERLGAGGMGEVFAAYDKKLDRKVALKLLRHRSPEYEARLEREAQAMARLLHPNVVAVFDTGVVGERLYLAMEFVRGTTLRTWQKAQTRPLADTLRVYRGAGEGLAAAHAAGLVHRDFKPDNVLIADDGRVKVTDFGIARAIGEQHGPSEARGESPSLSPDASVELATASTLPTTGSSLDNPLTEEGTLLGTPGYMAPEQFLGEPVDARTDQYSFCVSLYQALYDTLPFCGGRVRKPTLEELAKAALMGIVDEPPKGSTVPAHVRRVLLRGLSVEREARYPSMNALLEDLARDPSRRRRRLVAAAAALAVLAAAGTAAAIGSVRQKAALRAACVAEADAITTHWRAADVDGLRGAMLAEEGASVGDRTARTLAALDGFAQAWHREQHASCLATRLERSQSEETHAKRSACLLGARQTFDAVTATLREPDASVHRHSLDITSRALRPPSSCSGKEAERLFTPLPAPPDRRARAEEARNLTVRARIAGLSGRYKEAAGLGEKAAALAHDAGAPAVEAVAVMTAAQNLWKARDPELAFERARGALRIAERLGDDHTAAEAAGTMAYLLANELAGRKKEAASWLDLAWDKFERVGDDDALRMKLLMTTGVVELENGNPAAAVDATTRAIGIGRALFGESSGDVCYALTNLAAQTPVARDFPAALSAATDAVGCWERLTGADNPELAMSYGNQGQAFFFLGRFNEAARAFRHAADLHNTGPVTTYALACLATAEVGAGHFAQGGAAAEDALHLLDEHGKHAQSSDWILRRGYAVAHYAMGRALLARGDAKGAKEHCGRSVLESDERHKLAPEEVIGIDSLRCLGEAELALGDVVAARAHLERSVALPLRPIPGEMARTRFALARALSAPPKADLVRAREQAALAKSELERDAQGNPALAVVLADVGAWLAGHGEASP